MTQHNDTEAMREAFEAWAIQQTDWFETLSEIDLAEGRLAWRAYQAALQSPQVTALKRELETVKARYEYLCGLDASSQDLRALVEACRLLGPLGNIDFHGKWRIQKVLSALTPFTGESNGK